jgi:hypothetical protein
MDPHLWLSADVQTFLAGLNQLVPNNLREVLPLNLPLASLWSQGAEEMTTPHRKSYEVEYLQLPVA